MTLLQKLDQLSQSKSQSVAAIQAISSATILHSKRDESGISSSKKWTSKNKSDGESQRNANLIILATYVLNQIMVQFKSCSNGNDKASSKKKSDKGSNDNMNEKKRYYAMIMSIYSSVLSKVLLMDKTQLERTINTSVSISTSRSNSTGSADHDSRPEEGYDAKSVLGRALVSTMLSSLKSTFIFSSIHIVKPDSIYSKLLWRNANTIERVLGLGSNYRSIRGSKGTKNSVATSILNVSTEGMVMSKSSDSLHGFANVTGGVGNSSVGTSVHNIPMDLKRANIWNEICNVMESENELLIENETLFEALSFCNKDIFEATNDNMSSEDLLLRMILFDDEVTYNGNKDLVSKSATKKRKTDSSIFTTTSTRTRSRSFSDKNDQLSSEYLAISAQVSEIVFSVDCNKIPLGGNRFNLKKWASSIFTWICDGQEVALKSLYHLMMSSKHFENYSEINSDWHRIMQISALLVDARKTPKKGKLSSTESQPTLIIASSKKGNVVTIPGNLVLLTYASRIIDIVTEGGKMSGSSLTRNGSDRYVNFFNPSNNATSKTSGSSKSKRQITRKAKGSTITSLEAQSDSVVISGGKSKSKSSQKDINNEHKLPDLCNLSIILMQLLLEAHQSCVEKNILALATENGALNESELITQSIQKFPLKQGEVLGQIMLNEDNDYTEERMTTFSAKHSKEILAECRVFPLMHKTIETLIKCASSTKMTGLVINHCATRLTGIGAALGMKSCTVLHKLEPSLISKSQHKACVVNTLFVVDAKLTSWAVSKLSSCLNSVLSSSGHSVDNSINGQPQQVVQQFSLDIPLVIADKFESLVNHDYLGVFGNNLDLNGEVHGGDILSLFLRAMIPHSQSGKRDHSSKSIQSLIELLLRLVSCCYSLDVMDMGRVIR